MKYLYILFFCFFSINLTNASSINISFNDLSTNKTLNKSEFLLQNSYQINYNMMEEIATNEELIISDFPINSHTFAKLKLKKTHNIFKENTKFYINNETIQAPKAHTYIGHIENIANSKVQLIVMNNILSIIADNNTSTTYFFPSRSSNSIYNLYHSRDNKLLGVMNDDDSPEDYKFLIELKKKVEDSEKLLSNDLLQLDLAYEADIEVYKGCGSDFDKTEAYILALLTKVSAIYEEFINIRINLSWLKIWSDASLDPYNAKGDYEILRDKALVYWDKNYQDVERNLYQASTSISYGGGGFGYLDILCKNKYYAMSVTSLQTGNNFNSFNFSYDTYITAHELGHNLNAQHTHSCYWNNAPLDTCVVDNNCLSGNTKAKPNPGSIMSYCGGTNSSAGLGYQVRMIFRPENVQIMRTTVENAECLQKITEPHLAIISPNGGEYIEGANSFKITWQSYNIENIDIYYSISSGKDWILIEKNVNASSTEYNWEFGEICSNKLRIKIVSSDSEDLESQSAGDFIIKFDDPDKLVAYYPFDNNGNDEQFCHFYNATNINAVQYSDDRAGNSNSCAEFSGGNYFKVDKFNSKFDALTLSFWLNLSSLDGNQHIIGTDWQNGASFSVYYWGQLGLSLYFEGDYAPTQVWAGSLDKDKWYKIDITYDGQSARMYVDGILKSTLEVESTKQISESLSIPFYIGAREGKEYFTGKLDEVKIYNRALSGEEILSGTSISDDKYSYENKIYPNPAYDYLLISNFTNEIPYQIYSLEGLLIDEGVSHGRINLLKLNCGIYILKFNNRIFKFVKI